MHFPRYWPLCGVCEFPSQRPVTRSLMLFVISAWTNGWVNNRGDGGLRCHCAHFDVIVTIKHSTLASRWLCLSTRNGYCFACTTVRPQRINTFQTLWKASVTYVWCTGSCRWCETPSRSLWRHCNDKTFYLNIKMTLFVYMKWILFRLYNCQASTDQYVPNPLKGRCHIRLMHWITSTVGYITWR